MGERGIRTGFWSASMKEEVDCLEDWGVGWRIRGLKHIDFFVGFWLD